MSYVPHGTNDALVRRWLAAVSVPSALEPAGIARDGKRPSEVNLVLCGKGAMRAASWEPSHMQIF